jgi:hypothetical protein
MIFLVLIVILTVIIYRTLVIKNYMFIYFFRYQRIAAGAAVIILMIFLVLIFILAVIIYRTLVKFFEKKRKNYVAWTQIITNYFSNASLNYLWNVSIITCYATQSWYLFWKSFLFFQVQIPLFQNDTTRPMAQLIASMSGAMVNLLFIMLLGRVYENLALRLTTWGKMSSFILFENRGSGSFTPMLGRWNCNAPPEPRF